jgi:hypothetical protein
VAALPPHAVAQGIPRAPLLKLTAKDASTTFQLSEVYSCHMRARRWLRDVLILHHQVPDVMPGRSVRDPRASRKGTTG